MSKLNTEIVSILSTPEVKDRLVAQGAQPAGNTPEEFAAFIKKEMVKWAKVIQATGTRAD